MSHKYPPKHPKHQVQDDGKPLNYGKWKLGELAEACQDLLFWTNRFWPELPDSIEIVEEQGPRKNPQSGPMEDIIYQDILIKDGNLSIRIGTRHYYCRGDVYVDNKHVISWGRSMLTGITYTNNLDKDNEELIKRSLELVMKARK